MEVDVLYVLARLKANFTHGDYQRHPKSSSRLLSSRPPAMTESTLISAYDIKVLLEKCLQTSLVCNSCGLSVRAVVISSFWTLNSKGKGCTNLVLTGSCINQVSVNFFAPDIDDVSFTHVQVSPLNPSGSSNRRIEIFTLVLFFISSLFLVVDILNWMSYLLFYSYPGFFTH